MSKVTPKNGIDGSAETARFASTGGGFKETGANGAAVPPPPATPADHFKLQPPPMVSPLGMLDKGMGSDLPEYMDCSTQFSVLLIEHLKAYWKQRRSVVKIQEGAGSEPMINYAQAFARVEEIICDIEIGEVSEAMLDKFHEKLFALAPDQIGHFTTLEGNELLYLQVYHGFAIALLSYKAAQTLLSLEGDEHQSSRDAGELMLKYGDGSQALIDSAMQRFGTAGVEVPPFIEQYAGAVAIKITQLSRSIAAPKML
jgi:hypothetical protein